jgi:hypothetical protein
MDISAHTNFSEQMQSKPLVDALKTWLETELARVSAKSVVATAIRYGLKHWDRLVPWFVLNCSSIFLFKTLS